MVFYFKMFLKLKAAVVLNVECLNALQADDACNDLVKTGCNKLKEAYLQFFNLKKTNENTTQFENQPKKTTQNKGLRFLIVYQKAYK